jgi:bifunctional DNA-binding transcriptional regulator/antitoxin component of YhaV-PrlF toxin-antitoxin module
MGTHRVQIRKNGSVVLPPEVLAALEAGPGSYLELTVKDAAVEIVKIAYDPWTEAQKKTTSDFDEIMKRQQAGLEEAEKDFMEKLKKPPEIRPEDRRDFWD